MANKPEKLERREMVDPAVADLMGSLQRSQAEKRLPTSDRKRRTKEREKARKRNRVMLDIAPEITKRLEMIAEGLECPVSQVASLLLSYGLEAIEHGRLDLEDYLEPSKSPRYSHILVWRKTDISNAKGHPLDKDRDTV